MDWGYLTQNMEECWADVNTDTSGATKYAEFVL